MDEAQSREEMAAHLGLEGPVAAAAEWMDLVLAGQLQNAWPKTDPTFRLVLAQAWLWANRERPDVNSYDRDEAAASLADLAFQHDLWAAFETTQVAEAQQAWSIFERSVRGAASRPRPIGPGLELVLFVPTGPEGFIAQPGTAVLQSSFLMRMTPDGWVVAGFSDQLPGPGWPPVAR